MTVRRRLLALIAISGLIVAACGDGATAGREGELRATVEMEYLDIEPTLVFRPGELRYASNPWVIHEVVVDIGTDDFVQTFVIFDRYLVQDSELVPGSGAEKREFTLWDEGPMSATLEVVVPEELPEGEHRVRLDIPVHLEASYPGATRADDRETIQTVEFVYEVFRAESPLVTFCARADQILWERSPFTPQKFIDIGEDVLSPDQIVRFEEAIRIYEEKAANQLFDPNDFFDLIEEICDVEYKERWMAMA